MAISDIDLARKKIFWLWSGLVVRDQKFETQSRSHCLRKAGPGTIEVPVSGFHLLGYWPQISNYWGLDLGV